MLLVDEKVPEVFDPRRDVVYSGFRQFLRGSRQ